MRLVATAQAPVIDEDQAGLVGGQGTGELRLADRVGPVEEPPVQEDRIALPSLGLEVDPGCRLTG